MSKPTVFTYLVSALFILGGYLAGQYILIALGLTMGVIQTAISINGSD